MYGPPIKSTQYGTALKICSELGMSNQGCIPLPTGFDHSFVSALFDHGTDCCCSPHADTCLLNWGTGHSIRRDCG